jgi:hypothetical protein
VQSLWFEEVSLIHEPLLDTPIGRLTLRQTAALILFALSAWMASLLFTDVIFKLFVGGAVFTLGAVIFTHKVKTVPPERCILLALGIGRARPRKPVKMKKRIEGGGRSTMAPTPLKKMRVSAMLDAPIKVVGVLKDPSNGKLLPHRGFEFIVDGVRHSSGVTDEQGFFTVFFAPQRFGVYRVEVRPDGYAGATQTFMVQVEAKGRIKTV